MEAKLGEMVAENARLMRGRKADATRSANLGRQIAALEAMCDDRTSYKMCQLIDDTIRFLARDHKPEPVATQVVPTTEDLLRKAEELFGETVSPEELEYLMMDEAVRSQIAA